MSDEQRPPDPPEGNGPAGPASGGGAGAGDTPRDGVPAFDDIDIQFDKDTVPPAGPSPDHASEYVPPRPLPKPVEHRTMENVPIALSPDIDPRRMRTQKAMHVLKREEAERALAEMGIAPPTTSVVEAPPQPAQRPGSSKLWLVIVLLALAAAGAYAAYTYTQQAAAPPAGSAAGVIAIVDMSEPAPVQKPTPPREDVATGKGKTPPSHGDPALAPDDVASGAPSESATPPSAASADTSLADPPSSTAASTSARKPKATKDAPRPINE